jgi:hypothetical protein
VNGSGSYSEDSLFKLYFTILRHRFHHLCKGEGWRD